MKKNIIIAAFALLGLASCQKEKFSVVEAPLNGTCQLEVGFPEGVKTCLGEFDTDGYPLLWKEGDVISVNGVNSAPLTAAQAGKSTASFSFEQELTGPFTVVYPASAISSDKVTIPAAQAYEDGQFDSSAAIMLGYSESAPISLKMATSLIKVNVDKDDVAGISSARLISRDGKALCGTFSYDAQNATLTSVEGGSTLSLTDVAWNKDDKASLIFTVPAAEYTKGFFVNLTSSDGDTYTQSISKSGITLAAGSILAMNDPLVFSEGSDFSGGKGTEDDPYIISTAADLRNMATLVNFGLEPYGTACYKQGADIENAALVDHIGIYNGNSFMGVYDGDFKRITNVTFSSPSTGFGQGLFGQVENCSIENVNIDGFTNTVKNTQSGILVGRIKGNCDIVNCNVTAQSLAGKNYVGGIAGYIRGPENCTMTVNIRDCSSNCAISGAESAGGIVGEFVVDYNSVVTLNIENCTSRGSVTATGEASGGIIANAEIRTGSSAASSQSTVNVINCRNEAAVNGQSDKVGGIAACSSNMVGSLSSFTVTDCENAGQVTGAGLYCGGIVGYVENSLTAFSFFIDKCVNCGNVSGVGNVGGILGYTSMTAIPSSQKVYNSYCHDCTLTATGAGKSTKTANYVRLGGVVGGTEDLDDSFLYVNNCCSYKIKFVSNIDGTVYGIGGVLGSTYNVVTDCVYSSVVASDITANGDISNNCGAVSGWNSGCTFSNHYYDKSYKSGPSKVKGSGITTANFTNGTLLGNLNSAASGKEGYSVWVADADTSYPVPSGAGVGE